MRTSPTCQCNNYAFLCACIKVANSVGRAEILSCIFFLLSLMAYIKSVSSGQGRALNPLNKQKIHLVLLSITFSACAMLSKEQGVMVIGVCGGFDYLLHWEVLRSAGRSIRFSAKGSQSNPVGNSNTGESIKAVRKMTGSGGKQISDSSSSTVVLGTEEWTLVYGVIKRLGECIQLLL